MQRLAWLLTARSLNPLRALILVCSWLPLQGQRAASQADIGQVSSANSQAADTAGNSADPVKNPERKPAEEQKGYLSTLVAANNLPNLLLVVVGIGGVVLAWRTVKATRDAAQAALLNAQAVINAERALLLFVAKKVPTDQAGVKHDFQIRVVNCGRLPARNIEIGKPIHTFTTPSEFASMAGPYYVSDDDIEDIQEYLLPKEEWLVATFHARETWDEHMVNAIVKRLDVTGKDTVMYGQVTYNDGISDELRHSRYCFAFDYGDWSVLGGSVEPYGPPDYRECS